ncbi:MAG: ornithine carbamoyltransferase [Candidatus Omnitrophota bacterium]
MKKDFLSIKDLSLDDINQILDLADDLKQHPDKFKSALSGKTIVMIFEKPSNRTFVSFQVGMYQLGGNALYLGPEHIKLGIRESVSDVAKTLSRYAQAIILRTFAHKTLLDMAKFANIPVINGLSDFSHPCQALSDIFTIKEKFNSFGKVTLVYIGDGNNVCNSLIFACAKVGLNLKIATPKRYQPKLEVLAEAKAITQGAGAKITLYNSPEEAVGDADIIYTDVWASMGQEKEARLRRKKFRGFQINSKLLSLAKKNCLIMHCLPAHRGEEITDEVIDSKNSIVFNQAENRLHVQKAILLKLLNC